LIQFKAEAGGAGLAAPRTVLFDSVGAPMEFLVFALVAIGLYFLSDWLLRRIEAAAGRVLEHRSLVFFAILLGGALLSFWLFRLLLAS
jgi:hypothetical protein